MSYRVEIHTDAPLGHHGRATVVEYASRAEAEQYARDARRENPAATVHVTNQHEDAVVPLERAREWMAYLKSVLDPSPAFTDHNHAHGSEHCPVCANRQEPQP